MEQNVFIITYLFTCKGREGNREQLNKLDKNIIHTVSQRICIV